MKATVLILGACVLAPLAGGFAGAAINTTPLVSGIDPLATIPRHESSIPGALDLSALDTPDHYPLVTPQGTIPVEQLIFHGRPTHYADGYAANPAPADPVPPAEGDPGDYRDQAGSSQLVPAAGEAIDGPLVAVGAPPAPLEEVGLARR